MNRCMEVGVCKCSVCELVTGNYNYRAGSVGPRIPQYSTVVMYKSNYYAGRRSTAQFVAIMTVAVLRDILQTLNEAYRRSPYELRRMITGVALTIIRVDNIALTRETASRSGEKRVDVRSRYVHIMATQLRHEVPASEE